MNHFDEGSLARETTRCLRQLGGLEQARQQAGRIISLRPSHRTRSRASASSPAGVLIAQRQPDQACGIAADVLNATQSLGSYERDPEAWNAFLAEANAGHGACRTVIVDRGAVSAGR